MSEDGSVYLNSEKSANTHWEVKDNSEESANTHWEVKDLLDGQIRLKNVITKKFLIRLKKKGDIGAFVLKEKNRNATIWTWDEENSLKSYENDYLNSETDK